jgi:hypothetical protein
MTFSDYVIDIALIAIVLFQIRGRRLTVHSLLLPLGIVGYVVVEYLKGIPTGGNDLILIGLCTGVGALLGALAAVFTSVTRDGAGFAVAKAGVAAAALWVLGVGMRLAFQLYVTHGGADSVGQFSSQHQLAENAWVDALILMALAEAVVRTGVLAWRAFGPNSSSLPVRDTASGGRPAARPVGMPVRVGVGVGVGLGE